jgi:hypothetical protein
MKRSNHTSSSEPQRKLEQIINNTKRRDNWAKRWEKAKGYPVCTRLHINRPSR